MPLVTSPFQAGHEPFEFNVGFVTKPPVTDNAVLRQMSVTVKRGWYYHARVSERSSKVPAADVTLLRGPERLGCRHLSLHPESVSRSTSPPKWTESRVILEPFPACGPPNLEEMTQKPVCNPKAQILGLVHFGGLADDGTLLGDEEGLSKFVACQGLSV